METWKQEWARSFRTAEDLLEGGFILHSELESYRNLLDRYAFCLPRYYAGLIDRTDRLCPIRRQAIPSLSELDEGAGKPDPLQDLRHRPVPRITHRYKNRALLHLTPNCAMLCRYCFRKTLLNEWREDFFTGELKEALNYLRTHSEIREVILSGGDPLMVPDDFLESVLKDLETIPSLLSIRIHSRTPVTFPDRVTSELVNLLSERKLPTVLVLHFNHPKELTPECTQVIEKLRSSKGLTLLNQTVLLRGVNDSVKILSELSRKLFASGVLPYYLHHPDPAEGTADFFVDMETGLEIYEDLRRELPGYQVPRYVTDQPSLPYKIPVAEFCSQSKAPHLEATSSFLR